MPPVSARWRPSAGSASVAGVRLPVPGPRNVLNVLERGADSVEQLLGAVPRMISLLGDADQILGRVDGLINRIDETCASADEAVRRTAGVVDTADELLSRASPMVDRITALLNGMEPSLTKLQPTLDRLAETTDPREVDALVALIDMLPELVRQMETDVVPVMNSLSTVAPDLHDLLDVSRELNEILGSLPGVGRIKKRIDEEQAAEGRG